jgi:hypothetical protein
LRYYDLSISNPQTGGIYKLTPNALNFVESPGGSTFTSYANGKTLPGALNVEFDIPAAPFNTPQGAAIIRVWGIGLPMIGQASSLNGVNLTLSAGMKKGLPLANRSPSQNGLILQASVYQAFGNWQGTNQTLDMICYPLAAQAKQDILLNWPAGMPLSTALTNTFTQAFGKYQMTPKVTIANLTQTSDGSGHYDTLSQLADYIAERSTIIGQANYGEDYSGVLITIAGNTIYAFDSQQARTPIALNFTDLIGQPTWIEPGVINFKTVLRADLAIGSQILFPTRGIVAPYVLTSVNAAVPGAAAASKTVFQGAFEIREVHHFANYRQPEADAWNTTFSAVPVPT